MQLEVKKPPDTFCNDAPFCNAQSVQNLNLCIITIDNKMFLTTSSKAIKIKIPN